jgi:uncharacterized protein YjbJ (UPF0337 family)
MLRLDNVHFESTVSDGLKPEEATVNRDQVQGDWETIKGKAKRIWGELTDDDFKKAEGNANKLYGTIQSRFGETKEIIKSKIDKLHL